MSNDCNEYVHVFGSVPGPCKCGKNSWTDKDVESSLVASGGLLAPINLFPKTYTETYRVKGILRRWRHRRAGYSTEWTVEYDLTPVSPLRDALPAFTAKRGGISVSSQI